jgi:hypothetical protein
MLCPRGAGNALAARITSHPDKKKPAMRCGLEERDFEMLQVLRAALSL